MLLDLAILIETIEAWECALNEKKTPTILVLTRQNVCLLRTNHSRENLGKKRSLSYN